MTRPKLHEILDLPPDHPLVMKFLEGAVFQCEIPALEKPEDEESQAYFDKYIAGDR